MIGYRFSMDVLRRTKQSGLSNKQVIEVFSELQTEPTLKDEREFSAAFRDFRLELRTPVSD